MNKFIFVSVAKIDSRQETVIRVIRAGEMNNRSLDTFGKLQSLTSGYGQMVRVVMFDESGKFIRGESGIVDHFSKEIIRTFGTPYGHIAKGLEQLLQDTKKAMTIKNNEVTVQ
jgi:hypothetical protein